LIKEPKCIYSLGLNRSQIAGLSFHGRLNFNDYEKNINQDECTWLITNPETLATRIKVIDPGLWEKFKVIRRPADKREDIVIYQRKADIDNK
jgi:hypothetical protein